MIAGYLPEADRASLRAASAWLAWSLPASVCFDVEARLRKSKDPAFWEWALQHLNLDALQRPVKLFHKAVKLGVVIAVKALSGRVARADARKALRDSAWGGHLEVLKHLHQAFGLSTEDARADHNCALRYSAQRGHLDIVMYLREAFGLTSEHARADDNEALRDCARHGHLDTLRYLHQAFGLTAEDARAQDNEALRESARHGHLDTLRYLHQGFGLTAEDARAGGIEYFRRGLYLVILRSMFRRQGFTVRDDRVGCVGYRPTADGERVINYALRHAAIGGHLPVVKYLREGFGLTADDARAEMNEALRSSAVFGHLAVVKYLREGFGLTVEDARVAYGFGNVHPEVDEYMRGWIGVQPSCPETANKLE